MQNLNLTKIVLNHTLHLMQRHAVYLYHLCDSWLQYSEPFKIRMETACALNKSLHFTTVHGVTSHNTLLLNSHGLEKIEASMMPEFKFQLLPVSGGGGGGLKFTIQIRVT